MTDETRPCYICKQQLTPSKMYVVKGYTVPFCKRCAMMSPPRELLCRSCGGRIREGKAQLVDHPLWLNTPLCSGCAEKIAIGTPL